MYDYQVFQDRFGAYPIDGFGGYPLGDVGSFVEEEATTTPAPVPSVLFPAPQTFIQRMEDFLISPFGIIAIVAGSLLVADRVGWINLREIFDKLIPKRGL